MEIGLKAIRISAGFTELFEINGDSSWTSKVRDVRSDLECIDNIQLSKEYLMLTNIDEGFLLSIVIPISGRKGDCVNVWLFIPKDVEDTTCVEKIIEEVVSQFGSGRFNREKLQEVVDKCGAKKSSADRIVNQSKGDIVAYRVFKNEEEKRTLLGALNQKYYSEYKTVMFLSEEDKVVLQSCVDLTSEKIKEEVVVEAPQSVKGFRPYIYGKSFDNDMWLEKESKVDVIWKRENYNDIQKSLQVGVGEVEQPIVRYLSEYTIICSVTNQWVEDEKVTLNNGNRFEYRNNDYDLWITVGEKKEKYSSSNRYIITENNSLCIDIEYEDCLHEKGKIEKILDLKEQQEILINMKEREELKIEDKIFVLKSDKDDMSFKNFEVKVSSNGTKELKVKDKPKKKVESESKGEEPKVKVSIEEWLWRLVSFFVGVLVAVLVIGSLLKYNQKGNGGGNRKANVEQEAVATKDTSDVDKDTSKDVACINYLIANMNNGWSKDSLDFYPLTRGLFEAMIKYDFNKMKEFFNDIYKANGRETLGGTYTKIVKCLNKLNKEKPNKFKGMTFAPESDGVIELKKYEGELNKIKDATSAKETSVKRSNSSSDKKPQNSVPEEKNDSLDYSMTGEDRNDI